MQPGERIGRYVVVRRLASGGMAEVYLARHEGPQGFAKRVVIKRILPGLQGVEKFTAMFLDEGRLAARLSHPSIAQTFELAEHEGIFHIVMEYVPGESLGRLVKRASTDAKPIPPGSVLRIAMQVLEALDYAHDLKGDRGESLKVVHRDVSPTNVVITYHGSVKLLDFGIARSATHEHHTRVGTVKGKGGYMSPEQALASPVDQRTDLYAVGALLYLLTTGAGPFDGQDDVFAMMRAAVEGRFPKPSARNPQLHPQLEQIILKAMAQKADDRYATAGLMLAHLEDFASSQRLFPSSRELTLFMRQLFPERVELARSYDEAPDAAVLDKLAESFEQIESSESASQPTKGTRRADEVASTGLLPSPVKPAPKGARPRGDEGVTLTPMAMPRNLRPTAKTLENDDHTPLHVAKLPPPARVDTRTVPVGTPAQLGAYAGAVPDVSRPPSERRTQESHVVFAAEDNTAVPAMSPARTVSAEQELTGPSQAQTSDPAIDAGPRRTRSLANMQSVGNLVAANPWAFVVAGLVAVLLGVAVLWALGGD